MGRFGKIGGAGLGGGRPYIQPGKHVVAIEQCVVKPSEKPGHADNFIIEVTVVSSQSSEAGKPAAHVPGQEVSKTHSMRQASTLSNIKNLAWAGLRSIPAGVLAEAGLKQDVSQIDEDFIEKWVLAGNMFGGLHLRATAFNVPTQAGGTYTKIDWQPLDDGAE